MSVLRTAEMQRVQGGIATALRAILECWYDECETGIALDLGDGPRLHFIQKVLLLADAEGLRALSGTKGSSGTKPCLKCSNVLSHAAAEVGLPEGHTSLAETSYAALKLLTQDRLAAILRYMQTLRTKKAVAEAETLLGWNLDATLHCQSVYSLRNITIVPFYFAAAPVLCTSLSSPLATVTDIQLADILLAGQVSDPRIGPSMCVQSMRWAYQPVGIRGFLPTVLFLEGFATSTVYSTLSPLLQLYTARISLRLSSESLTEIQFADALLTGRSSDHRSAPAGDAIALDIKPAGAIDCSAQVPASAQTCTRHATLYQGSFERCFALAVGAYW
eukprot:s1836_g10.t1